MELDKRSTLYECLFNCPYNGRCSICPTPADVDSLIAKHEDIGYEKGYRDGYAEALDVTDNTEPVKRGHWINISISANGYESSAECDLCGAIVHNNFSSIINYCPNCGAKMDEDRDYERAVEQLEHDMTFEPTYNPEDGSM